MEDFILSYQNGEATVFSNNIFFKTSNKPKLSFNYDTLICESPSNLYFYMAGENQILLTEEQINEIKNFCDNFYETGDYLVYAYDKNDNNMYKGNILKSKAIANNYSYVVNIVPENPLSSFNEETNIWISYYAVIIDDGTLIENASFLACPRCMIFLTKEDFDKLPKKTKDTDKWDFVNECWVDKRDLTKEKYGASLELRNLFEAVRWKLNGKYIPAYEQDTWRIQLEEAKAWSSNKNAETPYADKYLETIDTTYSKEDFMNLILENNKNYTVSMAYANGLQYNMLMKIENCTTCYEVDDVREANKSKIDEMLKNDQI